MNEQKKIERREQLMDQLQKVMLELFELGDTGDQPGAEDVARSGRIHIAVRYQTPRAMWHDATENRRIAMRDGISVAPSPTASTQLALSVTEDHYVAIVRARKLGG